MNRLKLGMVGGGRGAFIGGVHRMAARLDGDWDLVAGALSSDPERAKASAADLGIAPDRSYASFEEMARAEAARADGIDAVSIVTPNHLHAGPAIAFLRAGIHVICDKPLSASWEDAQQIEAAARASRARFFLTHTYSGYPMVRQARDMVADGAIGTVRFVNVEYVQDWLAEQTAEDNKQAAWRENPTMSGAGAIADIGVHAFHLAGFISGLTCDRLAADLSTFVPGRAVDDHANIFLRFSSGAKGLMLASQVCIGNENTIRIRVHGDQGSLDWTQDDANYLRYARLGEPIQILTRNGAQAGSSNINASRVPGGHPEGYIEAFANIYRDAARSILTGGADLPGVNEGTAGMRFILACQSSDRSDNNWVALT